MGIYFYPRGGSAHVCRALAREFERNEFEVDRALRLALRPRRARPRAELLRRARPARGRLHPGAAERRPGALRRTGRNRADARLLRGSPGAEDPVLASLDDDAFELQVEAWTRELQLAGAAEADLLYLHHLTPLNEAAARAFPEVPVLGHVHGTELLMLERIAAGAPAELDPRRALGRADLRLGGAAASGSSSAAPAGLKRAAAVLDLDPERFVCVPNGFDPSFAPRQIDRRAHWRRHLVERPQGWRPGLGAGQRRLRASPISRRWRGRCCSTSAASPRSSGCRC